MYKKLLIVAASAAMLAIVSLSGAYVVGGPELHEKLSSGDINWSFGDEYDGPVATRQFDFDAGSELNLKVPVELHFERSDTVSMAIEGPQDALDDLIYENGVLSLRTSDRSVGDRLKVTITAPSLAGLRLEGAGDAELVSLDQDAIEIHSAGAADVRASGKVGSIVLVVDGAADFDFENVQARDADIEINGAGDIDISAVGNVDIEINGAGSITLHAKPAQLTSEINGAGSVDHDY